MSVASSSSTILMTCWSGVSEDMTSLPVARALIASVSCRTTGRLTSASSSDSLIARIARSMSASLSLPRPRRPEKTPCSLSERFSNISRGVYSPASEIPGAHRDRARPGSARSCTVAALINLPRLRRYIGEFGVGGLLLSVAQRGCRHARYAARRLTETPETFEYRGERYTVVHHRSGRTWLTERAIELPVAMRFVDGFGPLGFGLEVGNVLSRYRPVHHRVVDKYEQAPRVENIDVLDVATERPFDFIVSISTLEHAGWDEAERDLDKPLRAIHHLRSLLRSDGGRLLVTLPLGYNPAVDRVALDGTSGAAYGEILVRDRHLRWAAADRPEPQQLRYEFELRSATAVWIGEFGPN